MAEDIINFELPVNQSSIIKVIGVGGGGGNAVNHMCRQGIKDVNFVVCNTDAQDLEKSPVSVKIQLGKSLTEGRGAGSKPEVGQKAAIENIDDIIKVLSTNTRMVFITAGMGGGTGTGAAPVIAKTAKEMGILTVAIVTIPFRFEGEKRFNQAIDGINELREHVDSLLIVNNERLREIYGNLKFSEAFAKADNVLTSAAKGIAEIITVPGYINVDFADVQTIMTNSGLAIMGSGIAEGEGRALKAVQEALTSPLLNNNDVTGAKSILLNITYGTEELTMDEITEVTDYVTRSVAKDSLLIWGTGMDEDLGAQISVTIIATGFEANSMPELAITKKRTPERMQLYDNVKRSHVVETAFEVKDKRTEGSPQRTIEFDISNSGRQTFVLNDDSSTSPSDADFFMETKKSTEEQKETKKSFQKVKEPGYNNIDEKDNIEDLENQPAYLRKKVKISGNKSSVDNDVSRYTLSDDEENTIKIRHDNAYLHDNVD
jgi:cell division protein FtsZ